MILLNDEFMKQELDFAPLTENNSAVYKDYYYKVCSYIGSNNPYKLLPSDIEKIIQTGSCVKTGCCVCKNMPNDEREYLFKRAMGLQLIYDMGIGRNTMAKGSNTDEDICRETKDILNSLGLLKQYGVVRR